MHFDHIELDGSPAFIAATQTALALLKRTASWGLMARIGRVRELINQMENAGGYLFGNEINVGSGWWQGDPRSYAAMMAHEGCHMEDGGRYGPEAESGAFRAQAQALRELGGSRVEIADIERQTRNPTHQAGWEANNFDGQFGGAASSQPVAEPEQPMGSVARMAARYHGYRK